MLSTQIANAPAFPAFIGSFSERKAKADYRETLEPEQSPKTQTTIDGLTFLTNEILASSQNLGWRNIRAFRIRHENREVKAKSLRSVCVVLQLENDAQITARVNNQTIERFLRAGELMIFPAGTSANWEWKAVEPNQVLYFFLEPSYLEMVGEVFDFAQPGTIETAIGAEDEQLRLLALSLLCEMNDSHVLGHDYADALAHAFALQIVRRYSRFREINLAQGGMAPFKLRKALGFIHENLEFKEDLSLDKVASEVGMSYFHFSRTFKQSMGVSPNNYIVARRVELAKKLLAQSDSPIADIALQAGFANQSHFTTMFRRQTGTTPKTFRRNL
ncbi:MAG TPA: AraC family transcriptional regulator [Pyrinomonadaceae bacterium]